LQDKHYPVFKTDYCMEERKRKLAKDGEKKKLKQLVKKRGEGNQSLHATMTSSMEATAGENDSKQACKKTKSIYLCF